MTYEEIVEFVRDNVKKTGVKSIEKHVAVEFDIYGEGEGAFYVEADNGVLSVEPYEYYDRDAKIIITADELIKIIKGEKKPEESVEDGILMFEGDKDAAYELEKLIKKTAVKKTAAVKAPEKKTESKKTAASAGKKTAVKVEKAIVDTAKKANKPLKKDTKKI